MVLYAHSKGVQEDTDADALKEDVVFDHEIKVFPNCQKCLTHFLHVFRKKTENKSSKY